MGSFASKLIADQQSLPGFAKFWLAHFLSRVVAFWGPNLLLYIIHQNGWFMKYKIQGGLGMDGVDPVFRYSFRMPSVELVKEALTANTLTDTVAYWGPAYMFYKLLTFKREDEKIPKAIEAGGENEAVDPSPTAVTATSTPKGTGWSYLRFDGPMPSAWTSAWQVAFAYAGYDFMFYWSHRALHHPSIYKYIHKVHHQFHTPVGPSCAHEHFAESVTQLFNWYIPIGLAGYLNKDLHSSTLFYYHCFRWIETVDAHCGFEFPFSPFHFIPIFGGARMHDFHHREFYGNYGASMFWDWFCGTDQDFWTEVADKMEEAAASKLAGK